ncbi:MAG: MBL fold metallo-hydrolase [Hyphomonadaceae bacterium]
MSIKLHFHGAAGCVTGSCARLTTGRADLLIDCGLFQGSKTLKALNYGPFPFDARKLDAVLLTHAHVDHSGLLPKLALAGFKGLIYATRETRALCSVMLPDAGAIQEMEVEALNRRNRRRGLAAVSPIYSAEDAGDTLQLFQPVRFGAWIEAAPGVRARWWNAGHILGAGSIEIEIAGEDDAEPMRLLFSGDVGPGGRDFAHDPTGPAGIDHLIVESTYGALERPAQSRESRRAALAAAMKAAHAAGGPLVIPAFAVERTQELLADLIALMEDVEAPPGPIFLDSPLAIKATDVFLSHAPHADGQNPFGRLRESRLLRFTESAAESREIERFRGWHIIVAASGMCDAGRIRHHLKRLLWREETTVMLVGFQPVGTLGRLLLEGAQEVRIQGEPIRVRARITMFDGYSGHADGPGLAAWAQARAPISGTIFLTHGEPPHLKGLSQRLSACGFDAARIKTAKLDQMFTLRRAAADEAAADKAPRAPQEAVSRLDWHNARAAFLAQLNARLQAAATDDARKALLEDLSSLIQ